MIYIPHMGIVGVGLILVGSSIRWAVRKRQFKRRNLAGLELFPTFAAGVVTRMLEWIALVVAKGCILGGILFVVLASV